MGKYLSILLLFVIAAVSFGIPAPDVKEEAPKITKEDGSKRSIGIEVTINTTGIFKEELAALGEYLKEGPCLVISKCVKNTLDCLRSIFELKPLPSSAEIDKFANDLNYDLTHLFQQNFPEENEV